MKFVLLLLLLLLGLSCPVIAQTPAKGFEGSWQGTLDAGGQKLRLALTVTKSETPVFILTGSRDQQAVPEQVALMESAFKESGNKDVTARVVPDVNHLFVQDTDGFPLNYSKLPPPVMMRADVVEMIVEWLAQRLR